MEKGLNEDFIEIVLREGRIRNIIGIELGQIFKGRKTMIKNWNIKWRIKNWIKE